MSNTSLMIPQNQLQVAEKIDNIVLEVIKQETAGLTPAKKTFIKAWAVTEIANLLTDEYIKPIMSLQGKKYGFLTDAKRGEPYNQEVVKDCIIEAWMLGLEPVGNQFNILSSKMYPTKEGSKALLMKIPNLWYEYSWTIPEMKPGSVNVKCKIEWKKSGGQKETREISFPVRVNTGMTIDAIMGKAERKANVWLYNIVTGNSVNDGDFVETQDVSHIVQEQESKKIENLTTTEETEVFIDKEWQERADAYFRQATNKEELESKLQTVKDNVNGSIDMTVYNEMYAKFQ